MARDARVPRQKCVLWRVMHGRFGQRRVLCHFVHGFIGQLEVIWRFVQTLELESGPDSRWSISFTAQPSVHWQVALGLMGQRRLFDGWS